MLIERGANRLIRSADALRRLGCEHCKYLIRLPGGGNSSQAVPAAHTRQAPLKVGEGSAYFSIGLRVFSKGEEVGVGPGVDVDVGVGVGETPPDFP